MEKILLLSSLSKNGFWKHDTQKTQCIILFDLSQFHDESHGLIKNESV